MVVILNPEDPHRLHDCDAGKCAGEKNAGRGLCTPPPGLYSVVTPGANATCDANILGTQRSLQHT